jgi:hypothetical protein
LTDGAHASPRSYRYGSTSLGLRPRAAGVPMLFRAAQRPYNRRMRPSSAAMLSALAVMALLLPAPVAAGGCWLGATVGGGSIVDVEIGEVATIEGFEFAVGDVDIAYAVDGAPLRRQTVTAEDVDDRTGYLYVDVTPQPGEHGMWQIVFTEVNGNCSVSTGFPVPPAPTGPAAPVVPDTATGQQGGASSLPLLLGAALLVLSALIVLRSSRVEDRP